MRLCSSVHDGPPLHSGTNTSSAWRWASRRTTSEDVSVDFMRLQRQRPEDDLAAAVVPHLRRDARARGIDELHALREIEIGPCLIRRRERHLILFVTQE